MQWISRSEIVAGLCLKGKLDPHAVDPSILHFPYDNIIVMLRDGKDKVDILDVVGPSQVLAAEVAAGEVKKLSADYIKLCQQAAVRCEVANRLSPLVRKWERGEDADVGKALAAIGLMEKEQQVFTPLSEVDAVDAIWQPTFYPPIDDYIGGLPHSSLIVMGGAPGCGKTSLLIRLMISAAKKGKRSAFFSLEMEMGQIVLRSEQIEAKLSMRARKNILASDGVYTITEIYAHANKLAANYPDLYMIGIDFADMILPERWGQNGVAVIDQIYRMAAALAKQIRVPVVVLSQFNEGYVGGRPRVNHLRGSRLIEALGALVILLYNPDQLDVDQKSSALPYVPGTGYLIFGKSRYGFKEGSVGAVQVHWNGKRGWGSKPRGWFQLAGG